MDQIEIMRPRLKPCLIQAEGAKIVLEELGTNRNLMFDAAARPLFELLDGNSTLQEIVAQLHKEGKKIRFHTIFKTIDLLKKTGFLEDDKDAKDAENEDLFELAHGQLNRIRFSKTLISKLEWKTPSKSFFYFLSFLVVAGFFVSLVKPGFYFIPNTFAYYYGSHFYGLLLMFVIASVLMTLKGFLQMVLELVATGKAYNLAIKISRFSVNIGTSDAGIYLNSNKSIPFWFHLASLLSFISVTAVGQLFLGKYSWFSDAKTVAFFLTLLEMNPYLKSELQKIFQLFTNEDSAIHQLPYLKNRAIFFPILGKKDLLENQFQLFAFASYALSWSLGSLYFCLLVLQRNYPNLMLDIQTGMGREKFASIVALGLLGIVSAYFYFDLIATLAKNVYYPIRAPMDRLKDSLRVKKEVYEDQSALRQIVTVNPLFLGLSTDTIDNWIKAGVIKSYPKNSKLISQGLPNYEIFVIIQGTVSIKKHASSGAQLEIAKLSAGAAVGELSVIKNEPATADVIADEDVLVLSIHKSVISRTERNEKDYQTLLGRVQLAQFFGASKLFSSLPIEAVQIFLNEGRMATIPAGTKIIEQGNQDKLFYLLVRGQVEIIADGKKVKELNQGDFFGEISLISDAPRTATVRTTTECVVHRLDSESFWAILSRNIYFSLFIESIADLRHDELEKMHKI